MASFTIHTALRCTPDQAFAGILDLTRWPSFRGSGPIPGIVEASLPEGASMGLGARVRVRNTDGSVHHEVVTTFEPGRRYSVAMEVSPPASYVMETILEDVVLEAVPGGTAMTRRFELRPRTWFLAPLAWVMTHVFLKRAVVAHNEEAARWG